MNKKITDCISAFTLVEEYNYFRKGVVGDGLRFGQYIFGRYSTDGIDPWPEFFYETDAEKAFNMIWSKY